MARVGGGRVNIAVLGRDLPMYLVLDQGSGLGQGLPAFVNLCDAPTWQDARRPPSAQVVPLPRSLLTFGKAHKEEDHIDTGSSTNDDRSSDPVEFDDDDDELPADSPTQDQAMKTTLMVRNVPVMYTQDMLVAEWQHEGQYDFLYLPRSAAGQSNLSYAFINFVTEAQASAFKDKWQKKRLPHFTAKKALNISFADVQGVEANLVQLKKKRVRRIQIRQCQPIVFRDGRRIEFTDALATIGRGGPASHAVSEQVLPRSPGQV